MLAPSIRGRPWFFTKIPLTTDLRALGGLFAALDRHSRCPASAYLSIGRETHSIRLAKREPFPFECAPHCRFGSYCAAEIARAGFDGCFPIPSHLIMPKDPLPKPRNFKGVMISSTFMDLEKHRAALIRLIEGAELVPIVMENDSAKPDGDVVDSSLEMVKDAAAYVGIIAQRYGQTPKCAARNPRKVSITELEFDEAVRLGRPILLFIMGDDHPVKKSEIELKAANRKKLDAFRKRAKKMDPASEVNRVYATFESLEDFERKAAKSISDLRLLLEKEEDEEEGDGGDSKSTPDPAKPAVDPIPKPPAFYAEPPYIGSHDFVGRKDQLETLNEWALPADSHPVLLFEAIGGTGKSMLTWEWVRNHALGVRQDWEGRFWYSFYERGAIMADFCRHALAYMTGQPLEELNKKKTVELAPQLLHQLRAKPWLLILDGLERVLVAYHRIDAAQLRDEEAGKTDEIARRDPCAAIRPEDDDLLRMLATAAPSKMLLTSRLIPRVLVNAAGQPIPGVLRQPLQGLRPTDAEALFRACGVKGDSKAIQSYLKEHCDCHALTIGTLAGLVTHYLPARGDFDKWSADPNGGGKLDFANLDLVQKRNHILKASIAALPEGSRRLLSMIALLSEAVNYETLKELNPNLPVDIKEIPVPKEPEKSSMWLYWNDERKEKEKAAYVAQLKRRREYEEAVQMRLQSPEFLAAPDLLGEEIEDLEKRGLLQYDARAGHYDLHPVVRGVATGGLVAEEKNALGQRVVDHFSTRPHNPYAHAETLEDVRDGLHVARTLLQMGRFQEAGNACRGDLADALLFNLEAYAEMVSLLRPFFRAGWGILPQGLKTWESANLAVSAGNGLGEIGQKTEQMAAYISALPVYLEGKMWSHLRVLLNNVAGVWLDRNRLGKEDYCLCLHLDIAELINESSALFRARQERFEQLARVGRWEQADALWEILDPMERNLPRSSYRPGSAECSFARARFWQGRLREGDLLRAEKLAQEGRNRHGTRSLFRLRGSWRLEQGEWALAAESLHEAVTMAQAVGQEDRVAEAQLALAKLLLGQLPEPRVVAESLAQGRDPAHLDLAALWLAIGDQEQAKKHALEAYGWAWADGEPFVRRYELNKARVLLGQLGVEIPDLPPYDPAKEEKLPWEDEVRAAIEELRAEKEAKAEEAKKAAAKKVAEGGEGGKEPSV